MSAPELGTWRLSAAEEGGLLQTLSEQEADPEAAPFLQLGGWFACREPERPHDIFTCFHDRCRPCLVHVQARDAENCGSRLMLPAERNCGHSWRDAVNAEDKGDCVVPRREGTCSHPKSQRRWLTWANVAKCCACGAVIGNPVHWPDDADNGGSVDRPR